MMHREYLGDGVYASHDGYQIWLAVGHHENKVVALDDDVMQSLIKYHTFIENLKRQMINGLS